MSGTEGSKVSYLDRPPSKPKPNAPSFASLLDRKIRKQMVDYSTFGHIGYVISEAMAYIDLLEEELARREKAEATK